jgi:hypothetical protein
MEPQISSLNIISFCYSPTRVSLLAMHKQPDLVPLNLLYVYMVWIVKFILAWTWCAPNLITFITLLIFIYICIAFLVFFQLNGVLVYFDPHGWALFSVQQFKGRYAKVMKFDKLKILKFIFRTVVTTFDLYTK